MLYSHRALLATPPDVETSSLPCIAPVSMQTLVRRCTAMQSQAADMYQQCVLSSPPGNRLTSCTARARRRLYPSDSEEGAACMLMWVSPTACST